MTGWNSWDELTQELPRLPPAFFDDPVFRPGGPPPVKDVGPAVEDGPVDAAGPGLDDRPETRRPGSGGPGQSPGGPPPGVPRGPGPGPGGSVAGGRAGGPLAPGPLAPGPLAPGPGGSGPGGSGPGGSGPGGSGLDRAGPGRSGPGGSGLDRAAPGRPGPGGSGLDRARPGGPGLDRPGPGGSGRGPAGPRGFEPGGSPARGPDAPPDAPPGGRPGVNGRPSARPPVWPGSADETVIIPPGGDPDETVIIPPITGVDDPVRGGPPSGPPPRAGRPAQGQSLGRASRTMAIASAASRLTGFLRSLAVTAAIGVALVGNAYNTANTLPNIVYELLLGGVLTSVVVPLLVQAQERDRDGGEAYTQRLLSLAVVGLVVTTLLATLAAPLLTVLYSVRRRREGRADHALRVPPAAGDPLLRPRRDDRRDPQHPGRLRPPGLGAGAEQRRGDRRRRPVLRDHRRRRRAGHHQADDRRDLLLGIGTTLGIVAQALVLLPALRRTGFRWKFRLDLRGSRLGEAGPLALWVIGYVVVSQIGYLVQLRLANGVPDNVPGVTTFTNASLLFQMPYGILGVSLLTALMPRMSRAAARGDQDSVLSDLSLGSRLSALALLPVTALFIVLGPAIGTVIYGHGRTERQRGPRRSAWCWRSPRSGWCRSRSRCCSCGCSTR